MPILLWLFSPLFIAGLARFVVASLGFGVLYLGLSSAFIYNIKNEVQDWTNGGNGPGGEIAQYLLLESGATAAFASIISAYAVRIALRAVRRLALFG